MLYEQYGCRVKSFSGGLITLGMNNWYGTLRACEPEDEYPNASLRYTLDALKIDWQDFWSKLP